MNDTKFLGLCILVAALMISTSIIWSTEDTERTMTAAAPVSGSTAPATTNVSSVTISGPVTLAPITTPIPVTISTPEGSPITVKDAAAKQWNR